ncbi:MAG: helix-turn-helix domain-containing protein [Lachnospiraceae bacterium]|nr:helix-turn-helix domain-containing protein [Lachnospiraceae bacterium]
MDQVKIGKFMAEIRKQRGMTQKELAEQVGISDKTISKWECGNSIPDISYLEALCNSLDITVNELLSGEKLSEQSYSEKAEENIMALMKENEIHKKGNLLQMIFGIVLAGCAFILMFASMGVYQITNFLDFPSLILIVLFLVAGILISGKRSKDEILDFIQKTIIPIGALICLVEVIVLLHILTEPSLIGPNLAVCILVPLYCVAMYVVVIFIKERK